MSEGDYIFSHLFLEFESPSKQYSRLLIFLRSALQIRETACASKHAAMTCSYDTESGLACQEFESKKAETEKRIKKNEKRRKHNITKCIMNKSQKIQLVISNFKI